MPRRRRSPTPDLALDMTRLWLEASAVMALRVSLLSGPAATAAEATRMVAEKQPAFAKAAVDASTAAMTAMILRPFDPFAASSAAACAWTRSVTRAARGNRKRLTKPRKRSR